MPEFMFEGKVYVSTGTGKPTVVGVADYRCPACGRTDRAEPVVICGCGCLEPMKRRCETCDAHMNRLVPS